MVVVMEGAVVVMEGGTANSNLTDENDGRRADTYQSSGICTTMQQLTELSGGGGRVEALWMRASGT